MHSTWACTIDGSMHPGVPNPKILPQRPEEHTPTQRCSRSPDRRKNYGRHKSLRRTPTRGGRAAPSSELGGSRATRATAGTCSTPSTSSPAHLLMAPERPCCRIHRSPERQHGGVGTSFKPFATAYQRTRDASSIQGQVGGETRRHTRLGNQILRSKSSVYTT